MHITSSGFINDDESGLHHDYEVWPGKLAPHEPVSLYRHNGYEDNADAHLKVADKSSCKVKGML
ncbi:MAG: YjbQ family protein [Proteobacteria bacterium]|nr:YjbQ family protein [Pseudomonadota bacterium]MBU0967208.1 YjbQ family protein [Pseudomonadota bacterium]